MSKTPYYQSSESVKEYIELAKDVSGKELIQKMKDFLPSNSSLLELGSGPGTDWRILAQDYTVVGSDNSKAFLQHLRTQNPDGTFLELDAVSLETEHQFEGIYSNKVLHHLPDAALMESIERQHEVLKPQGIICHSFWKGANSETFKGMFVNYHSESSLRENFKPYFELLLIEPYKEFEASDSLLLIGRKK